MAAIQKQHGEHLARKVRLRQKILADFQPGAAYVPFIGDGDLSAAAYPDWRIYGVDIDSGRIEVAGSRLSDIDLLIADCDEGWPFAAKIEARFNIVDADSYAYPYGAIRAFWEESKKADRIAIFGTDAQRMAIKRAGSYRNPDGQTIRFSSRAETRVVYNAYWRKIIKPWLADLVSPDYRLSSIRRFERAEMLYWGAVAEKI